MARLIYTRKAFEDLERLSDFLLESSPSAASQTIALIEEAMSILRTHPVIGRPTDGGLHELVISRGHTGYVALYRYEAFHDVVLVLAIRHQREAGHWLDA